MSASGEAAVTHLLPSDTRSACTQLPSWVELDLDDDDDLPNLAFQHAQVRPTRFPDPQYPAQLHIDYRFPDGAPAAIERAERLGAIHMPPNTSTSQCYADPSGHPFCL
ncbi:hypothetical protein OHA18_40395 [Kribbella sp. NBC_00709]|uniref:VOC family protein n=1 Tax=Kribbella sp. NBC_00709 TaxID=2975972 RepID=UPI002E293284|nr:VOC family protein [Kribbella sp. NBC_00709]